MKLFATFAILCASMAVAAPFKEDKRSPEKLEEEAKVVTWADVI